MSNYIDETNGKNDSDDIEVVDNLYTVTLTFESVTGRNPLEVAKEVLKWIKDGSERMIYDVTNDDTNEKFTVDLAEEDEDAVQPNNG